MKKKLEIWTIRDDWMTIKKHASFEEADKFEHKDAYQTLYREGPDYPVHVYKNRPVKNTKSSALCMKWDIC